MSGYPILLEGARLDALVVGGGDVAFRRALALVQCGARVRVVAPELSDPLRTLAKDWPRLTLIERAYASPADIGSAMLVVAATNARAVNAQVSADAQHVGRVVSVVDAPDEGNCTAMAIHRANGLVIGVSAGGVPTAAARVRDAIAVRFDDRFGAAIAALGVMRRRLLGSGRRAAWHAIEREVIDDRFCARVEDATFAARLAAGAREELTPSEPLPCP